MENDKGVEAMNNDDYWCKVGDIVISADRSAYVGKVVRIDDTHVQHECVRTGRIQTKSRVGFCVRYMFPSASHD
jgi:hypothetical protein